MSNPGTPFLPQMLSPSAYEIGRYGRTPVSYFHGLPNISIPLTEVRARGFTIPVSLSYHAGGNKPDQHPGWVGLGWKLNAGGCIVRVVNGKKDEMSSMEYGALTGRYDTPGYLHHIAEVQTDTNWDDDQTFWNKTFFEHIEYEPDEYIIDAPGIHASFYITGPNKIAVVSRDESAIELESYDFGNDSGTPELDMYPDKCTRPIKACRYQYLKRFIIKDKYGNRYIFGGDDNAIEYSIVQKADIIRTSTGVNNSNVWKAFATADAWMLTRIERADGEVIIFEYERGGVPIVLRDIHHGEIFTSADAYYMSGQDDTHHDMTMGYKRNLNFLFLLPTYLKSIRCLMSGDELNFAAEKSQELQFAIDEADFKSYVADLSSEYSVVGPFSYSQFQEENYYRKLVSITGNSRDIRFSYTDNSLTRLKLNKIEICKCDGQKDGEYTFAYNETSLPAYNSRQTDIWGYYNGISYADLLGGFGSGLTARRIAVKEKMAAEILTCVTYPTGGRTEYTYEPHRYSKKALPFDFSPVACESEGEAGGLRIKTITDYSIDGEVPQVRTFEYSENGVSSGILSAEGECKIEGSQSFINNFLNFTGSYVLYNEMPILPLSDTDGNHVTYSFVREIFPDGSYVDHRFSNFDASECQDYAPAKEIGRVTGCPLYPKFTSRSLFRGLLTERTTYRAGGNPVLQETFTYGNIGNPDRFKSVSRHSYFGERVVFAAYISAHCGYPGMLTKKEVRYLDDGSNLKEIYTYTYNAQRLLESSQCSRVSATYDEENPYVPYDSETNGERYYYPKDRSGESYARMLDEKMHGVLVGKAFLRKGKVTGGTETVYVEREISGWDPERSSLIVPHKQFSSELTLPESISGYSSSPMTCMKSTPDFEAKTWDSRGNAKFIDLRNGSAVEQHWSARTGQPGMRVVTLGNPPAIHDRKSINIRVNTEESTCFSTTFITTEDTTLSLTLGADYGHALYLCVQLDTQYSYLANWAIPELPDSNWESIVGMHGNTLNLNIPAGEHSLIITITGVKGPSGGSGADCGTLMGSYSEAVPLQDTAAFIDLDTDDETGDGFHCEKGHEGPLEVSHSVTDGRAYILDYMLKEDGVWRYVSTPYAGGTVTIGGEGRTVSNVRIYPADSMPESFMWRRFTGMSARSDARGVTESYDYDDAGRLAEVRDNGGRLVRAHSYEFKNKGEEEAEGENRITSDEFTSADGESRRSSVNHYDGLGRLVRNVLVDGSPAGGDLVTRHEYDAMDREVKTWLPEVSSAVAPAMVPGLSPENPPVTDELPPLEADIYPYTENVYEASPLNRLLRKYGPGQAWRTADKAVRMYQMSNKTDISDPTYHRGFGISWSDNTLTLTREMNCTSAGMLLVEKTEDEDGRIRLDFKNVHGETVLSRSVCDDGSWNDTHFIYDAFGRLAGVLPPKLTAQLESSGRSSWTESEICDLAYLYRYDSRGNNIAKLIPGGGWTWFVYDKGDRMVLSQDVIQREQGQWTFRLEDLFGRECVTGTAALEMDAFADPLGEVNVYVTMPASPDYADTLKGYVATGLSLGSSVDILKVNYYDGYGFLGSGPFPAATDGAAAYDESAESVYGTRYALSERGLATGALVRVLDSSDTASYLWSVAYYDDRGRPVQTCESIPSGGYRREYYAYDFTGAVTGRKSVLTPSSGAAVTVVQTFTYDPMGRPVSVTHKVGDLEPRTVSLKAYDEIGRLSSEQRNSLASLLETRSYNLRSWLTGIDCPLFKESLRYQDGTTPQWGGNISEMSWGPGTASKNYRFGYDALSRLISADYSEGSAQASANARAGGLIGGGGIIGGEIVSEGHSESYHYDRNGNMDLLSRNNMMEMIGIEGNRITSVGTKAISYDAKGRQVSSAYGKAVATQYNILDLPQKHTVGNGTVVVDYRYAADGRKLQEKVTQGSSQTSRDYIGEFIYENGTLKRILFDGGYVDMIGDTPVYMFFIKDHLGSVRAVVSETGEVLQTNEFYPYGDLFSTAGTAGSNGNRYRFTGKELGDETGLYDFSARYLHTSLGRFTTIDPLAEKYPNISPYAYCNGNPVNFVDPDGRAIEEKNKKEWDKLYKIITKTASRVQRRIDKLESKGKTGSRLSYLKDRLSSINETLSTMKKLENSKHTYSLSHANGSIGEVSYQNGQIDINYIAGSVSNFVHELTHAGQFESGDIGFNRTTGAVYAQDIFDEVAAYRSQEYYSGNKVSHINADYVAGMTDKDGNRIYTLGGYSNTASVPVSVNTPYDEVAKAYLVRNIANEERPYHMVVDMYFNESQK